MVSSDEYLKTRKVAVIIALFVIVVCSIIYFGTTVAERNNEMKFKEVYGENAVLNSPNNAVQDAESIESIKTALV